MKLIDKIGDYPLQRFFLIGIQGKRITMDLKYLPTQQLWTMNLDDGGGFVINNLQVSASPNMLYNYRKFVDFGICCYTTDGLDPYYIDDFLTGRAQLFLLSPADVALPKTKYIT